MRIRPAEINPAGKDYTDTNGKILFSLNFPSPAANHEKKKFKNPLYSDNLITILMTCISQSNPPRPYHVSSFHIIQLRNPVRPT